MQYCCKNKMLKYRCITVVIMQVSELSWYFKGDCQII